MSTDLIDDELGSSTSLYFGYLVPGTADQVSCKVLANFTTIRVRGRGHVVVCFLRVKGDI